MQQILYKQTHVSIVSSLYYSKYLISPPILTALTRRARPATGAGTVSSDVITRPAVLTQAPLTAAQPIKPHWAFWENF